jgi:hypothetical protein
LGSAFAAARAAVETVQANLEWFEKYGGDISAWMTAYTVTTTTTTTSTTSTTSTTPGQSEETTTPSTTTTEGASSVAFNPIMCIIIVMGYIVTKY